MASDPSSSHVSADPTILVQELLSMSDPSQLILKVQRNPQVVLETFQSLANGNANTVAELNATKMRLESLEQNQSTEPKKDSGDESLLSRLVEILGDRNRNGGGSILIPDPPIFEGAKKNFAIWKDNILMKININSDRFPSLQSKLVYIYSRLDTICQTHIHSWVKNGTLTFESVESMMEILHTIFHDPNIIRDAITRLYSNKQRNKPFSEWIAEVRRDAAIADYDYESRHLRDLIFHNLNLELQQALIYERDIERLSLNEVVARLQDIENRQKAFQNAVSRSNRRIPFNFRAPQVTSSQSAQIGEPMDLSAAQIQPRSRLSLEEKNRRRNMGLCMYCAQPGHIIKNCPNKPPLDTLIGNTVRFEAESKRNSENE